jgi:RNA-binding protein 8A
MEDKRRVVIRKNTKQNNKETTKKRHRQDETTKHEKKRYRHERDQRKNPDKSLSGWVLFVRGIHEEAIQDDVLDKFVEHGEVKSIQMNTDRRTGLIKGYALVQYEKFEDAKNAIEKLNDTKIYGKKISVDWAFTKDPDRRRWR